MELQLPSVRRRAHGTLRAAARTQSSIAVSANGTDWVLINASPDILTQIRATPALQPARARRDSGIAAVMLMDAQIDHVTGLPMLREGRQLPLYCTAQVWRELNEELPLARVLSHYCSVHWHALPLDGGAHIAGHRFPERATPAWKPSGTAATSSTATAAMRG